MLTDRFARSRGKYHRLRYDRKTPLITRVTRVPLLIKRRGKRGPLLRINHGARVSARLYRVLCAIRKYTTLVKLAKRLIIRGYDTTFRSLRLLSSRFRP